MALVFESPLGQGLLMAGQALSQGLEKRYQNQAKAREAEAKEKERIANQDLVNMLVGRSRSSQQQQQQQQNVQGNQDQNQIQGQSFESPLQNGLNQTSNKSPIQAASDEELVQLAVSGNKNFATAANFEFKRREADRSQKNADRAYAATASKKYMEDITNSRKSHLLQNATLADLKHGILNRVPGQETTDFIAGALGKFGEPFISPEGAIISSGVKSYLIDSLSSVKGRPNQYLEQTLVTALPSLGKTRQANLSILSGFEFKNKVEQARIDATDKIADYYEGTIGYVPANIERLVNESLKPIVDELQSQHAYRLRNIQETFGDIQKLSSKKVVEGTPLTLEMATVFSDKYGKTEAIKMAKKLGYTIPTLEEYERYSKLKE